MATLLESFRTVITKIAQKRRFYERFRQKTHKCILMQKGIYIERSKATDDRGYPVSKGPLSHSD